MSASGRYRKTTGVHITRAAFAHVAILTNDNYPLWALKINAFLPTNYHARVIRRQSVDGAEVDPEVNAEYEKWTKSEQVALGLMIDTGTDLHFELCHTYERGSYAETIDRCMIHKVPANIDISTFMASFMVSLWCWLASQDVHHGAHASQLTIENKNKKTCGFSRGNAPCLSCCLPICASITPKPESHASVSPFF